MSRTAPFVAGAGLGAGDLNPLLAAWDNYTPTLSGINLGNGTLTARYYQQGKSVFVRIVVISGSTTTSTGAYAISLPVTAHGSGEQLLAFKWFNSAAGNYPGVGYIAPGGTTVQPYTVVSATNTTLVQMSSAGQTINNVGSAISFSGVYEAA